MKTETIIAEYDSEARARGHDQHRKVLIGSSVEPRVIKQAINQADRWNLPIEVIEVIEVTDRGGADECHDSRGNLSECLELVENYMAAKWTDGLLKAGVPKSCIRRL